MIRTVKTTKMTLYKSKYQIIHVVLYVYMVFKSSLAFIELSMVLNNSERLQ